MGVVRITDTILAGIADAIRAKTGDSAQIAPIDMPSEIESISGGGAPSSEVVAFIRTIYDENSIVTASKGSAVLQSDLSGEYAFAIPELGEWNLVNEDGHQDAVTVEYGREYIKNLYNAALPFTDPNKVLMSTWASESHVDYTESAPSWTWDDLLFERDQTKISYDQTERALLLPIGVNAKYHLGEANTSFTAYIIAKSVNDKSSDKVIICSPYYNSSYNVPAIMYTSRHIFCTTYNTNAYMYIDGDYVMSDDWHVYALSVDCTNKLAYFYADGYKHPTSIGFQNSGGDIIIGCTIGGYFDSSLSLKYVGIVNECENEGTVISNMQSLKADINMPVGHLDIWYGRGGHIVISNGNRQLISDAISDSIGHFYTPVPITGVWDIQNTYSQEEESVAITVPERRTVALSDEMDISHIPYSKPESIIASYDIHKYKNRDGELSWGYASKFYGPSAGSEFDDEYDAVHLTRYSSIYIDTNSVTNITLLTAYIVFKQYATVPHNSQMLGSGYQLSNGYHPGFFIPANSSTIYTTVYGSDVNTGVSALDWHVLTFSIYISPFDNKKYAYFYIDGAQSGNRTEFALNGHIVSINGFYNGDDKGDILVKYFGVVLEHEESATIIANQQHLMSEFGISGS